MFQLSASMLVEQSLRTFRLQGTNRPSTSTKTLNSSSSPSLFLLPFSTNHLQYSDNNLDSLRPLLPPPHHHFPVTMVTTGTETSSKVSVFSFMTYLCYCQGAAVKVPSVLANCHHSCCNKTATSQSQCPQRLKKRDLEEVFARTNLDRVRPLSALIYNELIHFRVPNNKSGGHNTRFSHFSLH